MTRFVEELELADEMAARGQAPAEKRFTARRLAATMMEGLGFAPSASATATAVRPRVLHIITGLGTGGAEASLLRLLRATHEMMDHAVVSLTTTGSHGEAITALNIPVYAIGLARGTVSVGALGTLRRITRDFQPTCVQGWMYHGNFAASILSLSGVATGPVLWNVRHALDAWPQESRTLRTLIRVSALFARQPHTIVYNSVRAARQHEALGFRASVTRVFPNGVDTNRFTPDREAGARVRMELGIPAHGFVVGMIARVDALKDHDTLLAAIGHDTSRAKDRPRGHDSWFLLVGTGTAVGTTTSPSPLDARIAAVVAAHPELSDRIVRLGERRDIPDILNACDVVTMSSRSEGSPNAVAEAMACGVPCVVTDVGDAAQLVGASGIVVAVGDAIGMSMAWEMLRADAPARYALGANALSMIRAHYTARAEADAYAAVWGSVSAGSSIRHDSTVATESVSEITPRPPRILMVSTVSMTLRAFLLPFADHFRALGWKVDGMAFGASTDRALTAHFDQCIDVAWSRNPFNPRNLFVARQVRTLVRAAAYDVVHVHTPVAAFVTRFALRRERAVRVVYTAHSFHADRTSPMWRNFLFRSLERIAARWTDHLVVLNRADFALARHDALVPPQQLHWHPGIGVDLDRYHPATVEERLATRTALGIAEDTTVLTVVAEFTVNKRQHDVITAIEVLRRRGGAVPTVLFIGDGATRAALTASVRKRKLDAHIRFLGYRSDVPQLVGASDALVLCSAREGLPRCILEAQAMETPVIGSDAKGTADLLADNRGLIVAVGDTDALASAITDVATQREAARARAQAAGIWVRATCGLPHLIALHEALYTNALKQPARRRAIIQRDDAADALQDVSHERLRQP
jgi:glycosyltransferase involved in cell wall biosynthesis